jgi:ABC-2 type transport system ATP-binding protein
MVVIKTDNLTKRFPRSTGYRDLLPRFVRQRQWVTAVDGLSLEVKEGELLGLLGPNGAGKTTLMKMLCTLVLPTSGTATVNGHDVVRDEQAVKELVGLISAEERSFYWRLTARQNLEFYASLYKLPRRKVRERTEELLTLVGLSDDADVRFHGYSSGMRQRLAIARGLLSEPRVLFIDEPTRSLDPVSARDVRAFLREKVVSNGKTAVLATHNMKEAEQLCDRLVIMNHGRVVAVGSIQEIRALFRGQEGCELEVKGLSPALLEQLRLVDGVMDCEKTAQEDGISHLRLMLLDRSTALPEVLQRIVFLGGEVCNCRLSDLPLEDIFVSAVGEAPGSQVKTEDGR